MNPQNINNSNNSQPIISFNQGYDNDTDIERISDQEKIDDILFNLLDPKKCNEATFDVLLANFSLIVSDRIAYHRLLNRLPKFLELTSHLPDHQYSLALLLGDVHLRENLPLVAMNCYAQAIKIGKDQKKSDKMREAHEKASELLYNIFKSHFLPLQTFKEKLEKIRREGDANKLKTLIEGVKRLKEFSYHDEGVIFFNKLLKVFKAVLNEKDAPGEFKPLVQFINQECESPIKHSEFYTTERYHNALKKFRMYFQENLNNEIRTFQREILNEFRKLFKVFLDDAFAVLGEPPCAYDIRAIGSVGREEPSLRSDLEFFVLIEDEKYREYFKTLFQLIELQVMSLGETPDQYFIFSCLGKKDIKGFFLDQGGNPLKISDLMGTVDTLASLQREIDEAFLGNGNIPTVPCNQVLASISLSNNSNLLFEKYQIKINKILDEGETESLRQKRALQLFATRSHDFKKVWSDETHIPNPINIKERFVQFLNFFLADLGLYFGIQTTNSLEIVDELGKQGRISNHTKKLIKDAVTAIYRIRYELHQYYQEHNEDAYTESCSGYVLRKREKEEIEKIYWLILRPLYFSCLRNILGNTKKIEMVFDQLDFISICLDEIYASAGKFKFFIPLIRYMAKETSLDHEKIFKRLSARSELDLLRQEYYKNLYENYVQEELLNRIVSIPNREGMRISYFHKQHELCSKLKDLCLEDSPEESGVAIVKVISSEEKWYLTPKIVEQIIDQKGDLKKDYDSNHPVTSAGGLHFKQKPHQAVMEYAIHNLFYRIAGDLTPATQLVRFEVLTKKNNKLERKNYPVLISTSIQGTTLKDIKSLPDLTIPHLWARWTWLLICSMLTRPGDGLPSNYLFDKNNYIFSLDNDISFADPIIKKGFTTCINLCCALFCLFQDRPLDIAVIEEFCSLDPDSILGGWIEDVIKMEEKYLKLFSTEERNVLYNEDPHNQFKSKIQLRQGTGATLNVQFVYMQQKLPIILKQYGKVTPLDLLKTLIFVDENFSISPASGLKIAQAYLEANKYSLQQRLGWITNRAHGKSLSSQKSDEACIGYIPTYEEVEKRGFSLSPQGIKGEFAASLSVRSASNFSFTGIVGQERLRADFKEMIKDTIPDQERQWHVLKALICLMNLKEKKPVEIGIQSCAVLNTMTLCIATI